MDHPKLLIADRTNRIYDVPLEATGMKGGEYFRLGPEHLIKLPPDSEMFMLPGRPPVGYDPETENYIELERDPFSRKGGGVSAVAAFLAPGYTVTYNAAYAVGANDHSSLPLFSYAAVAYYKGGFYAAGILVDREKRQRLEGMDIALIKKNVKTFRKIFSGNRLVRHLETCALVYGCPAAKNFFLKRYECPLPTSPTCNASCEGCISYQPEGKMPVTQPRIKFVPLPEEIAEIAIFHIREVKDPVVSFGQGCEGEPLMVAPTLERAVKLIRRATSRGMINLNTNASRPRAIKRLFDAGLDSIRVSLNSVRAPFYSAYYRPRGYTFNDVVSSIAAAKRAGAFVSLNYLVMPGFTDSRGESSALEKFLNRTGTDMIQWRNLNYDPLVYFRKLNVRVKRNDMKGIDMLIKDIKKKFPGLLHGYFNPSKGRVRRARRA